jgi:hypothetical protein
VVPVRYEHHLCIKSEAISYQAVEDIRCGSYEIGTSPTCKNVKLSPSQVVESHRSVSCEVRKSSTCKNIKLSQ